MTTEGTPAWNLRTDLELHARLYLRAGPEGRTQILRTGVQPRLDREPGLRESGKLAIWLGVLRDSRRDAY